MTLIIVDVITSIFQSIIFGYTIICCLDREEERRKIRLFFIILLFSLVSNFFARMLGDSWEITVFMPHVLALVITTGFYKKHILNAVTAYTIVYFIIGVYSAIVANLIFAGITDVLPIRYASYEKIFVIDIPEWILLFLCFKYVNKIKQIYRFILNEKFSIILLVMSFILDFVVTSYALALSENSQLLKNIIFLLFFMFFAAILIYFWKVHQKSEQIYKLNQALELKNNELRKIKHDYGAQISYLYGLCLMERFDDLKKSLKDIINNNESTPTAVEVTNDEKSILSLALKPAIDKGIHVIIEENCDSKLINMSEMEFFKVLSNIVNNAIKAMNGKGIILAKSYEYLGNAVIKIENNGPKIPEHHLKGLSKIGFSIKENSDKNSGYDLSIVKDLVESYNGKIHVKSTGAATEFKIVLPIQNA